MNGYVRLSTLKARLRIPSTAHDAALGALIDSAARLVDADTGRWFYAETATRTLTWQNSRDDSRLPLPWDLLSITALDVDQSGAYTYGTPLVVNTDYWLWPYVRHSEPYERIDLNPNSTTLAAWPSMVRGVRIAGVWGYDNTTELTGTTLNEALDATETAVDVVAGTSIDVGETIVVESEQMHVTAIASNTLTVVRGINGTTAATHDTALAVSRRRYPAAVEEATILQVGRLWRDSQQGDTGLPGELQYDRAFQTIRSLLRPFVRAEMLAKV